MVINLSFLADCDSHCYNLFMSNQIYFNDNLAILRQLPSDSVDLIYIDPPFNTGKVQTRTRIQTCRSENGDRVGFAGQRYETVKIGQQAYSDLFDDYLAFLQPRLEEAYRVLAPCGSLYFHIDYREVHYCKILLDTLFGRDSFINEIIWAYDYGARTRRRWPSKHDNILFYAKNPEQYTFNYDDLDRIPYMAPGLVGPEKAARGKTPTDTWWATIVPTNGREKTGYPTQKPLSILRRIISASSRKGDLVMDFFAGSGSTGAACLELDRRFILMDNNPQALEVMRKRFANCSEIEWKGCDDLFSKS
jgi:site-specific DNA-methyltransferase (adenine-specific)